MSESTKFQSSDLSENFVETAESAEVLALARAIVSGSANAPNLLVIVGPNGSGKTTLLQRIVYFTEQAAPEKKIVWLGDRFFSSSIGSVGTPSSWSMSRKIAGSLIEAEAISADMVIIDDVFGFLDGSARAAFWENLASILRKVPVVLAISNVEMLASEEPGTKRSLLEHAVMVNLNHEFKTPGHGKEPAGIQAEQAAAQLRTLDERKLPQQTTVAPRFDHSRDGPIAIAPEPAPTITLEKLELYEELWLKAQQFLTSCPQGRNRTAFIRARLESFVEYLPRDLVDVQPRRLWSRANTLRRFRDADLRLRRSVDPDELPLPEQVAEMLSDLVEQFNVFALHDEVLRQLDAGSLGPRDRAEVLIELEAGRVLSSAIAETPCLAEASAGAVLVEATEQALESATQIGINADQALSQALQTHRNGAIAVLAKALSEVKTRLKSVEDGAWKHVGTESAKFLYATFVRTYEGHISSLLGRIQGGEVASYVLRLLRNYMGF